MSDLLATPPRYFRELFGSDPYLSKANTMALVLLVVTYLRHMLA